MSKIMISQLSLKEQKALKPSIEDVIPEILDGDMKSNALNFVAWLRANKFSPGLKLINTWQSSCKGKAICNIALRQDVWKNRNQFWDDKFWHIQLYVGVHQYEEKIKNEGLQDFVWNNLGYCKNCNGNADICSKKITVLEKEINNFGCWPLMWVYNPDEEAIENIKKLLLLEKEARSNS